MSFMKVFAVIAMCSAFGVSRLSHAGENPKPVDNSENLEIVIHGLLSGYDKDVVKIKTDDGVVQAPRSSVDIRGLVVGQANLEVRMSVADFVRLNSSAKKPGAKSKE